MAGRKIVIAPDIPASEIMHLRAHVDETGPCGPDYPVVVDYEVKWDDLPDSRVCACGPYFTVDGKLAPEDEK